MVCTPARGRDLRGAWPRGRLDGLLDEINLHRRDEIGTHNRQALGVGLAIISAKEEVDGGSMSRSASASIDFARLWFVTSPGCCAHCGAWQSHRAKLAGVLAAGVREILHQFAVLIDDEVEVAIHKIMETERHGSLSNG